MMRGERDREREKKKETQEEGRERGGREETEGGRQ